MKGGRHLKYPEGTPMSNLLLTILDKAGVEQEQRRRQHGLADRGVRPRRMRRGGLQTRLVMAGIGNGLRSALCTIGDAGIED